MIYLIGNIIFSSLLVLILKYAERYRIDNFQTIIFNYITCVATGLIINSGNLNLTYLFHTAWWPYAALLGTLFFICFNFMAYTTRHAGITAVSLASKLSMLIPLMIAFVVYKEAITPLKLTGIIAAMGAIILMIYHKDGYKHLTVWAMGAIWVVFFMTGVCDSLVKWVQVDALPSKDFAAFNIAVFSFAAIAGTTVLLCKTVITKQPIQLKNMLTGACIGVPNYFSLLCLIKALHTPGWESSVVFPVNNIGIILFSVGISVLFLKEQLDRGKIIGIGLAVVSIVLMEWPR